MKLSPWFQPHELPVREGVYQVKHGVSGMVYWAKWNGQYWTSRYYWIGNAASGRGKGGIQILYWMGIVK